LKDNKDVKSLILFLAALIVINFLDMHGYIDIHWDKLHTLVSVAAHKAQEAALNLSHAN
jgi:uncharacterized membrane protein (Fun14 family)